VILLVCRFSFTTRSYLHLPSGIWIHPTVWPQL